MITCSLELLDIPRFVTTFELARSLHWLPVKQRIRCNVGLLVFKATTAKPSRTAARQLTGQKTPVVFCLSVLKNQQSLHILHHAPFLQLLSLDLEFSLTGRSIYSLIQIPLKDHTVLCRLVYGRPIE